MPPFEMIGKEMAVDSLYSTVCPACGDRKGEQKSLCYECFCRLPSALKPRLYKPLGRGYEEALRDALNALHAPKFRLD